MVEPIRRSSLPEKSNKKQVPTNVRETIIGIKIAIKEAEKRTDAPATAMGLGEREMELFTRLIEEMYAIQEEVASGWSTEKIAKNEAKCFSFDISPEDIALAIKQAKTP
jgi:hypothetical protein